MQCCCYKPTLHLHTLQGGWPTSEIMPYLISFFFLSLLWWKLQQFTNSSANTAASSLMYFSYIRTFVPFSLIHPTIFHVTAFFFFSNTTLYNNILNFQFIPIFFFFKDNPYNVSQSNFLPTYTHIIPSKLYHMFKSPILWSLCVSHSKIIPFNIINILKNFSKE